MTETFFAAAFCAWFGIAVGWLFGGCKRALATARRRDDGFAFEFVSSVGMAFSFCLCFVVTYETLGVFGVANCVGVGAVAALRGWRAVDKAIGGGQ